MDHVASLLLGLGNGGVYAALALAIVLTYRSSGVVNFATGAIALYAAYTFAGLRKGELLILIPGLPTSVDVGGPLGVGPAAAVALLLTAGLGALLYLVVFRPLRDAPPLARAVASLGVLLVLQGLMTNRVGTAPVSVPPIFEVEPWTMGSVVLLSDRFYLAASVIGLTAVLAAAYRWTRFGLHTRAAAETETGAFVSGISPDRIALANWVISATVAGAAGILIAPLSPLTPITYTLFVVPALAAAVVGGFRSVVPTVAAGIAIGMVQSEATALATRHDWMPQTGAAELVPLIVILVALLVTGRGIAVRGTLVRHPLGRAPRPRSILLPTIVGSSLGVVALLVTDGSWRAAVIGSFIAAVIALSLVVVTGYAGQVSLAQLTLAGVGAFTLSGLTQSWDVPFPLAPLLAALASTAVGVLVGLPALRVRGLTLGVVTLALAYAMEAVWFRNTEIVSSSGAKVEPPSLFGVDLGIGTGDAFPRLEFGLMCLAVLVAVAVGVARLRTSRLGSEMLAVRANERSAAGIGVNVTLVKLTAFAIASFIAGLGGSLLAYRRGTVSFDGFSTIGNLTLLSTAYLAGVTSVLGGVLAGLLAAGGLVFFATDRLVELGPWFSIISGALVIVTVIAHPEGLASAGHTLADRVARRRAASRGAGDDDVVDVSDGPSVPHTVDLTTSPATRVLDVERLTVRYGGVTAVEDVSIHVAAGAVVGLIGPNGAGKTSVIDAVTGFAPSEGTVELLGLRIDGQRPHRRVHEGLARTFQSLELYDDLTVEENVTAATGSARGSARAEAMTRALDLVGIGHLRDRPAGELSQGERQLVSIARACAADPRLLLLDEPAAGLDTTESAWLGERIRSIAASGVGVLLVDHDVGLVLSVCDHVYVLDFGRVIAEGDADAIRADRAVADAYLGQARDGGVLMTEGSQRLACIGLTGGHGATTAFRDVDLSVEPGRVLALLGPNGAGKTSLLLTVAGLLVPQGGTVEVDGRALPGGRPAIANRAGIVLVPDGRCLFTTLTVEENLQAASHRGGPQPRDLLDVFPALERRWKVAAGALSGGEQQMLAMARALVQDPKVMLVDEMSMGLAPMVTEALFGTIRHIATERGCSVVVVEQHVSLALEVADDAAVLTRGDIALRGTAAELAADPARLERAYLGTTEAASPA